MDRSFGFGHSASQRFHITFCVAFLFCLLTRFTVNAVTIFPSGFQQSVVFSGLTEPTVVRFAQDGRVFIAERSGILKAFDSLTDATADTVADLRTNVYANWDRGLLGMAIHPDFPVQPYMYVLYAYDFDPNYGGPQPPRWNDSCPDPTGEGCLVMGRLSRLEISANNTLVGSELVLLETNWCQQYPSHSMGTLAFGPEGALYVSAGDGASFTFTDYGQGGGTPGGLDTPENPCGDPPVPVGGDQTIPTAEGGALRSQDIRTAEGEVTFDGALLRIDPNTGAAWPTNPLVGGDPQDDRIIAYGLRNPFRMTIRAGTNEAWVGDVGWGTWEEINRTGNPDTSPVVNFGWPCYEGNPALTSYGNLNICINLINEGSATAPYYAYHHNSDVNPNGDGCRTGGSSISGLAFYAMGVYPTQYEGALFFADFSRDCIYVVREGANGDPDLATRDAFGVDAESPVHLEIGPGGDLYYSDFSGGKIYRIKYSTSNQPPTAVAQANPTSGQPPLTVQFDASASTDSDPGATLFYKWDLDGDGQYDDSNLVNAIYTYSTPDQYTVGLQVTDDDGATDTDQIVITANNTAPTATILTPSPTLLWQVGQIISFSGQGTDPEDNQLPPDSMHWEVILNHCEADDLQNCHAHPPFAVFDDIDQGSFTAPDHEWFSYLEIKLTVTDSGGLTNTATVRIDPQSVILTFESDPSELNLIVGDTEQPAPFSRTVIVGSLNSISAPTPQGIYQFESWSDGGAASHEITAGQDPLTYVATYSTGGALPGPWLNQDIGAVGLIGSATYSNGAFALNGSGADIWGSADAFHYVYQPFTGDSYIVARVTSVQNTNSWAKAGLMMRETLSAGSKNAMMELTPGNGAVFQSRVKTAGQSTKTSSGSEVAPYWVRLTRSGNVLAGYKSIDGINWTAVGTAGINMASNIYIGLAVTSHDNSVLCTAGIDSVTIGSIVPPTVNITSPSKGATFTAPATITIDATASDSDGSIVQVEFYSGSTLLGTDTTAPYSFTWSNVAKGSYNLTAKAIDNAGGFRNSSGVRITVK